MREVRRSSVEALEEAVWASPGPWARSRSLSRDDAIIVWTRILEGMGRWKDEGWQGEEDLRLAMSCPEIVALARMVAVRMDLDLVPLLGARVARLVSYHDLFAGEKDIYEERSWVAEDMVWGRRGGDGNLYEDVREADGRQVFGWRVAVWKGQEVVKVGVEEDDNSVGE